MSAMRRAKVVCTLGPACDSLDGLRRLISAGMDVARLNFSHGTHEEHGARLARLREASDLERKSVAALQDLCGPKIRTGSFPRKFDLPTAAEVILVEGDSSDDERVVAIQYEGLAADVRVGDRIMFDDGRLVLFVHGVEGHRVKARVEQGGGMRDHVGVHLPSKTMRISALTEKDKQDLVFGLSSGVDYIAMSFVRRAEDILQIREICQAWGAPTPVIAKIETPDAVENLESVVAASDGVMVARGDLGVEFPPERVPVIQRQILGVARRVRRPVIVATEMLQSMTEIDTADAGRSQRRRQCGVLRRGLGDAVGRNGHGGPSAARVLDDEPNRPRSGEQPVLRAGALRFARDERRGGNRTRSVGRTTWRNWYMR